jgi:hydroxymethylbilane synthase
VPTRLRKLDEDGSPFDALILAAAGLKRLDLGHRITEFLSSKTGGMFYAVGQGAIGVESRTDDQQMSQLLESINNGPTSLACLAERSLLRKLEGGCSAPLGVETMWVLDAKDRPVLQMRAIVVSVDGMKFAEIELEEEITTAEAADRFGIHVANALIAKGADKILDAIKAKKKTEVIDLGD